MRPPDTAPQEDRTITGNGAVSGDPVTVVLGSSAAGGIVGTAVVTAGLLTLRLTQTGRAPGPPRTEEFLILTVSVLAGLAAAVAVAVVGSHRVRDWWRRGAIAMGAVFAVAILGTITMVADRVLGTAGIVAYLIVLVLAFAAVWRTVAGQRPA